MRAILPLLNRSALLLGLVPFAAFADGPIILPANLAPSLLMENANGEYDHWKGVGRLESLANARCTAVLIDTQADGAPADAPAYLLTSGHCAYAHPQLDALSTPQPIRGHIEFNYFRDTSSQRQVYPLKTLHWSTQRGRDLAIIEVDAPLARLRANGIEPLSLAPLPPAQGAPLLSVSAPLTGNGYTLRVSACEMEGLRDVVEHPYVWRNNLRNACQDVLPGSSGSPLLSRDDGRIVGIMGTTTRGSEAEQRCATNTPCEITDGAIDWVADMNYATRTDGLPACFHEGRLDVTLEHCDLQDLFGVTQHNPYYQPRMASHTGEATANWPAPLTLATSHSYTKIVRNPMACEDPGGYSAAMENLPAQGLNMPLDGTPGMHLLCMLGLDLPSEGLSTAALKNVYVVAQEITDTPPPAAPEPLITLLDTGKYQVQLAHREPDAVYHQFKFGAVGDTDCDDPQGYRYHHYTFNIGPRLLPATLCTRAFDASGRPSPARSDLLEAPGE
jgi:hypothetical protein